MGLSDMRLQRFPANHRGSSPEREKARAVEVAMGRRKKSTKKIQTKKKQVVSTVFKCPFCSHDEAVECKMCVTFCSALFFRLPNAFPDWTFVVVFGRLRRDRERGIGHLSCRVCTESFQTPITCTLRLRLCTLMSFFHGILYPYALADLSDPIDVYTDWIDECEALRNG